MTIERTGLNVKLHLCCLYTRTLLCKKGISALFLILQESRKTLSPQIPLHWAKQADALVNKVRGSTRGDTS